jgi:F-type H+-transporting ATPase subunit gamma
MPSLRDIRRRIRSIRNTAKITKAMELVAASRLRRAQARIQALRPYADRMRRLTIEIAAADSQAHDQPLLARREVRRVAVLALTGDRGLAGAFNANIIRRAVAIAAEHRTQGREVRWLTVGRKGGSSLRFRGFQLEAEYTGITDRPRYADARAVADRVVQLYTEEDVDLVVMVYNRFYSALTQHVEAVEVLPVPESALRGDDEAEARIAGAYLEEPGRAEILAHLLPTYVETTIYRALLESTASEHGSRMTAMRNASDNASSLIDSLTLEMNRARQAEITQQILEVVAGADALE